MRPPVVDDPSLKVPATHLLVIAGVALVATVIAAGAQEALIPDNEEFVYSPGSAALTGATYVAMGGAVIWAARKTGNPLAALGLVRPRSWPRALGLALLTVLVSLLASVQLDKIFHGADAQGVVPDAGRPPGIGPIAGIALGYVAVALLGPIVEELIFRGLLTAAFRRRFGAIRTALITAAFFAVLHFIPRVMPTVFVLGLALALVYERVGSTAPGILVHCLFNGTALTAAVTAH